MLGKLLLALGLLTGSTAMATQTLICHDSSGSLQIMATLSDVIGRPIVGPVSAKAGKLGSISPRELVVQYKHNSKALYLLVVDSAAQYAAVEIDTFLDKQDVLRGRMLIQIPDASGKLQKFERPTICEFE